LSSTVPICDNVGDISNTRCARTANYVRTIQSTGSRPDPTRHALIRRDRVGSGGGRQRRRRRRRFTVKKWNNNETMMNNGITSASVYVKQRQTEKQTETELVSSCLTSLSSTNMAISETRPRQKRAASASSRIRNSARRYRNFSDLDSCTNYAKIFVCVPRVCGKKRQLLVYARLSWHSTTPTPTRTPTSSRGSSRRCRCPCRRRGMRALAVFLAELDVDPRFHPDQADQQHIVIDDSIRN